jgi:hypothetical protein
MFVKIASDSGLKIKKKGLKNFVSLRNVVQLAKFKFPNMNLRYSIPVVIGSVNSCGMKIKCS